jgi:hypothetical protein
VDCERSDAIEAGVIAGGVGEWHSVAGREDRVADDRRVRGDVSGRKRRWVDEPDDGRGGHDDDVHADNDDDDDDDWFRHKCSLRIFDIYV